MYYHYVLPWGLKQNDIKVCTVHILFIISTSIRQVCLHVGCREKASDSVMSECDLSVTGSRLAFVTRHIRCVLLANSLNKLNLLLRILI